MGKPVEQGRSHLGITEDAGPFREAEIGDDHHAGTLIELAQQVEQKGSALGAERQVTKLVEDDEIAVRQPRGDLPGSALGFLMFKGIG